jgi:hypothetical protein
MSCSRLYDLPAFLIAFAPNAATVNAVKDRAADSSLKEVIPPAGHKAHPVCYG